MRNITIYLAGPIDQVGAVDRAGLGPKRTYIRHAIHCNEAIAYDPSQAFLVGRDVKPNGFIRRVNDHAIREADAVVALMPKGVPTVGTPMEVEYALSLGKPVAVVGGEGWHLAGDERDLLRRFPWEPHASCDQAVEWALERAHSDVKEPRALRWTPLDDEGRAPSRQYPGDAGFDLVVSESTMIQPGEFVDIPCSIAVEFPEGMWSMLVGRSSTLRKRGLLVNMGIIDAGYRGPLYAGAWNMTDEPVTVRRGERIAQLIPMPLTAAGLEVERVKALSDSDRGDQGFGSTGE